MRRQIQIFKFSKEISEKQLISRLQKEWEQIEKRERKEKILNQAKENAKDIAKYLLAGVAVCGILAVAITAPNIFSTFGKLGMHRRFYKKDGFQKAFKNLKQRHLIRVIKKEEGITYLEATKGAKGEILNFCFEKMQIQQPEKWDNLWRIVIFDIPKKHSNARDALRRKLQGLGFHQIQMSVFVHPFECENEIIFLKKIFGIDDYVKIIRANHIDGSNKLRKIFEI